MPLFSLDTHTGTVDFDNRGRALDDNGSMIGSWTVNEDNAIVLNREAGQFEHPPEPEIFPASWQVSLKNQLCVFDEDDELICNFNLNEDFDEPMYELRKAQLCVHPVRGQTFHFLVFGEWDIDENHLLKWTVGDKVSVIDGVFSDDRSRLTYNFLDLEQTWISNRLTFQGSWGMEQDEGTPRMKFTYLRRDDTEDVFELPGRLIIERGINQFRYVYDKENRTFGVTLLGLLKISKNFEITYSLDRQVADDGTQLVDQTTFALQARFHGESFGGGALNLVLLRDNLQPSNYVLSVTGDYRGVVGDVAIMAGFRFSQRRNERMVTNTFGFGGAIQWKDNQVVYEFEAGGGRIALALGVDLKFENAEVSSKFTFEGEGGKLKKVTFLLGVRF